MAVADWSQPSPFRLAGQVASADEARREGHVLVTDGWFEGARTASDMLSDRLRSGSTWRAPSRGRYSIVHWDGRLRVLHAIRDPLGIRPLFFAWSESRVVVSPLLDRVLEHAQPNASLDALATVGELLLGAANTSTETPFERVFRVPAGHTLTADAEGFRLRRWYTRTQVEINPRRIDTDFADLLDAAIERSIGGRRPAVMLSGGLDSATIATAATRNVRARGDTPPVALAILNPTRESDEAFMQRRVAHALSMELHAASPHSLSPGGRILNDSLALSADSPWPVGATMGAMDRMARSAIEEGCDVVLTGDGGDEWLMPHPSFATNRLARGDLRALRRLAAACRYLDGSSHAEWTRIVLWDWGLRPVARHLVHRVAESVAPRSWASVRLRRLKLHLPDWVLPDPQHRSALARWYLSRGERDAPWSARADERLILSEASFTSALMEDNFVRGRRLGREVLAPFWDVDLVEFLGSIPRQALIAGGRAKALARGYVHEHLPFSHDWPSKTFADSIAIAAGRNEFGDELRRCSGLEVLRRFGVVGDLPAGTSSVAGDLPDRELLWVWDALALEHFLEPRLHWLAS